MGCVYRNKKEYYLAVKKLENALEIYRKIFKTENQKKIVKTLEIIDSN